MASVRVGTRVQIKDKDLRGTVAYVGLTEFAAGKWIGVALDEAKGKNNGSVQGKAYFQCDDKHGMFVRQTQILTLDEEGGAATPRDAIQYIDIFLSQNLSQDCPKACLKF